MAPPQTILERRHKELSRASIELMHYHSYYQYLIEQSKKYFEGVPELRILSNNSSLIDDKFSKYVDAYDSFNREFKSKWPMIRPYLPDAQFNDISEWEFVEQTDIKKTNKNSDEEKIEENKEVDERNKKEKDTYIFLVENQELVDKSIEIFDTEKRIRYELDFIETVGYNPQSEIALRQSFNILMKHFGRFLKQVDEFKVIATEKLEEIHDRRS